MKQLTIIIPHYNCPRLLTKLLDSIPVSVEIQTIVVDDKSNQYIDLYNKVRSNSQYAHVIFLENTSQKKGAGVCRNIGLNEATGKWVLFADADDFFVKGFLEKVQAYFEFEQDVIFFPPTSVELGTGKESDRHIYYANLLSNYTRENSEYNEDQIRFKYISPCSKMIRLALIESNKIKFDETLAANDRMFSVKVGISMNTFCVANDIIYCITKGIGTLTTNTNPAIFSARVDVFVNYYGYLQTNLPKQKFSNLHISGADILIRAIKSRYGLFRTLKLIFRLKEARVPLIDQRFHNPAFILKKLVYHFGDYRNTRKHQKNIVISN